MGFLDGMLGGVIGGESAALISGLIEKHGGIQGVVAQLEQQGLGGTVKSWVGPGQNLPISADQIHAAFGSDVIAGLAAKMGLNPQDLAAKLASALPQAVDHLTPNGVVPSA